MFRVVLEFWLVWTAIPQSENERNFTIYLTFEEREKVYDKRFGYRSWVYEEGQENASLIADA